MPMWAPESEARRDEFQRSARLLMDNDAGVRRHALDALKAMGPGPLSGLPAFIQILNKDFLFAREKCVRALSLAESDVIDAMWSLVPAKQTSEKTFRAEATAALERLRQELK